MIVERLRREAPSDVAGDCLAEMFAFEVANAPKARPEYNKAFGQLINKYVEKPTDAGESEAGDAD